MHMSKLERITVAMPEEMAAKLRAAVDSGGYATTSEVVREALREWNDEQDRKRAGIDRLKQLVAEADAGPSYPAQEVFERVRSFVAEEAAKYRAEDR